MEEKRSLEKVVEEEIFKNPNHMINDHTQFRLFLSIEHYNTYRRYWREECKIPTYIVFILYFLTVDIPLEYFLSKSIGYRAREWNICKQKMASGDKKYIKAKMRHLGMLKDEFEL